jgi:hypothetical protein
MTQEKKDLAEGLGKLLDECGLTGVTVTGWRAEYVWEKSRADRLEEELRAVGTNQPSMAMRRKDLAMWRQLREERDALRSKCERYEKALKEIAKPRGMEMTEDTDQEDITDFWHMASAEKLNLANEALGVST